MSNEDENACRVRSVTAPDGVDIPVPAGGVGLASGELVIIRDDAEASIQLAGNGYYVVVDNADPANDEAANLFEELTVEGAITTLEHLAAEAFSEIPQLAFKGAGLVAGVLVSLFTTSKLTREIFIRGRLEDSESPVTYCLLV